MEIQVLMRVLQRIVFMAGAPPTLVKACSEISQELSHPGCEPRVGAHNRVKNLWGVIARRFSMLVEKILKWNSIVGAQVTVDIGACRQ